MIRCLCTSQLQSPSARAALPSNPQQTHNVVSRPDRQIQGRRGRRNGRKTRASRPSEPGSASWAAAHPAPRLQRTFCQHMQLLAIWSPGNCMEYTAKRRHMAICNVGAAASYQCMLLLQAFARVLFSSLRAGVAGVSCHALTCMSTGNACGTIERAEMGYPWTSQVGMVFSKWPRTYHPAMRRGQTHPSWKGRPGRLAARASGGGCCPRTGAREGCSRCPG